MTARADIVQQPARSPLLRAIQSLNAAIRSILKWVSMTLVAGIALIVVSSVVFRYGFNNSLSWSEDAAKFLMVWMTFTGAPLGFKHGTHVSISFLPPNLPLALLRLVRALVHAIVLGLMVLLAWYGWSFAWNGRAQVALTIGDISMFWIFVCIPIGAVAMALLALENLVTVISGLPEQGLQDEDAISTI